jgi:hypothetical protein
MVRAAKTLIPLLVLGAFAYVYRAPVTVFAFQTVQQVAPCRIPITYTIGSIDPRFGISEARLQTALSSGEAVWEKAAGRDLFKYMATGTAQVRVNLVYDTRQETTDKLNKIGISLNSSVASYEALKAQYAAALEKYQSERAAFNSAFATYESDVRAYETEVRKWNAGGGAPPEAAAKLTAQKRALESRQASLMQRQSVLNQEADSVNAMVAGVNRLAKSLNMQVTQYNTTGQSTGEEFEEGVFESAPGREKIDIYEYDSDARLKRLIAHELGHALGMDHVADPKAIMYRLNQSETDNPTADDLTEMRRVCRM